MNDNSGFLNNIIYIINSLYFNNLDRCKKKSVNSLLNFLVLWRLEHSNDTSIRWKTVDELKNMMDAPTEKTIAVLIRIMQEDEQPKVREIAATTLGEFGEKAKKALPALIRVIIEDEFDAVRIAATKGLQNIGEIAIVTLFETVKQKKSTKAKEEAIVTLGKIDKWFVQTIPEFTGALVRELVTAMNAEEEIVGQEALKVLIRIGDCAVPILLEILDSGKDDLQKKSAKKALAEIKEKSEYHTMEELKKKAQKKNK
ncbi:MAG: hypothetical protein GF308_07835 [Candidatus Heimdallarchaeota archaeon]|nr:hypothetical protein [Candidatus Heimdallarchaeota archaeon]